MTPDTSSDQHAERVRLTRDNDHPYEFFCGRCMGTYFLPSIADCERLMKLPCPHQYDGGEGDGE